MSIIVLLQNLHEVGISTAKIQATMVFYTDLTKRLGSITKSQNMAIWQKDTQATQVSAEK